VRGLLYSRTCTYSLLFSFRYCPSVFVLKPGQHVHINKGRLHAFRKLATIPLPATDCHAKLRATISKEEDLGDAEHVCISVAWDWMYRGVSSEGINREAVATLECTALNRKYGTQSLAIPELSLLQMAQKLITSSGSGSKCLSFVKESPKQSERFVPSTEAVLKGILPSLRFIIDQHVKTITEAKGRVSTTDDRDRVSVQSKPNARENPLLFPVDPYGNGDFFCKLCAKELSNVYMHCDGCEKILNKDFNICVSCHAEKKYRVTIQMHPLNAKRHCTVNHMGNFHEDRQKRCVCKNGPACLNCSYCQGCSCRCHTWFTLNQRFLNAEEEKELLLQVEKKVGEHPATETMNRLLSIGSVDSVLVPELIKRD